MNETLTLNQAAEYLGIGRSTLQRWRRLTGLAAGTRVGNALRFTRDELDEARDAVRNRRGQDLADAAPRRQVDPADVGAAVAQIDATIAHLQDARDDLVKTWQESRKDTLPVAEADTDADTITIGRSDFIDMPGDWLGYDPVSQREFRVAGFMVDEVQMLGAPGLLPDGVTPREWGVTISAFDVDSDAEIRFPALYPEAAPRAQREACQRWAHEAFDRARTAAAARGESLYLATARRRIDEALAEVAPRLAPNAHRGQ